MKKRRLLTRLKAWERGNIIDDCRDYEEDGVLITLYNRKEIWIIKQGAQAWHNYCVNYNDPSGGYNTWNLDNIEEVASLIKEEFGKQRQVRI